MKGAFDVSLHAALSADLAAIDRFASESRANYAAIVAKHAAALRRDGAAGGHLWIADSAWARDAGSVDELSRLARAAGLALSACVDPREPQALSDASNPKLDGFVLSPVHGGYDPREVVKAPAWAKFCAELPRKPAFVTTAYGTKNLFDRDSLLLLADLLRRISSDRPVVALHGGGHRFKDLVLLADAHPNLSIDLSFSALYYSGSSLEKDWAWGLRRLGPGRFLFGSDEPFADRAKTAAAYLKLAGEAGWSEAQISQVFAGNAQTLFSRKGSR